MKIQRKKNVYKVRLVEHNKKVLIWIIVLLIVLIGLIIAIMVLKQNQNEQIIGGDKDEGGCLIAAGYSWCEIKEKCLRTWEESCFDECVSDRDCIKVESTCCSCNMGGEEICINKNKEQEYIDNLKDCGDRVFCTAVYNCNLNQCKCVNNKCSL